MNNNSAFTNRVIASMLSLTLLTAAGCGGISSKRLKQIGAVVAIGVAAKLIYDMVVDYQSKQINDEGEVVDRYIENHGALPAQPVLVNYESNIKPGEVVTAGNDISIQSKLEVVRGADSRTVEIQEKITIFDNEDNTKELKSLTKVVNTESKKSGAFENEFTFKLPKGMPQGVYPVRTIVIVDGKEQPAKNSQMQLVFNGRFKGSFERVASH
ncbi:MAG: hypothetical protein KUG78_11055 [Kangiellaceae bacterium]|nr:hypothetical protein [Kangiellaceae bacterium]